MQIQHRPELFVVAALLLAACAGLPPPETRTALTPAAANGAIVIEHVTVLPMTENGAILQDATVVIENGRIASLSGPAPVGAQRIDGAGRWLIPGLTDMHVHLPSAGSPRPPIYPTEPPTMFFDTQDIMTPFIANGVTQIVNMDSVPASVGQRNEIASGAVLGPHMALAAVINGGDSGNGRIANTPSDGRQAVRSARAEGYDFIKPYSGLSVETFAAIVDEADRLGMRVVGHIPDAFQGQLDEAFVPHFGMVAHAEEFSKHAKDFSNAEAERFAQLALRNGTSLSPTMTTMRWIASQARSLDELRSSPLLQYVHPLVRRRWTEANRYNRNSTPAFVAELDAMVAFHVRLVRAFHAAGVPILAGTDAGTSGVVAGFSLHDELELLVSAGLTPEEALASTTRLPSVWLGTDGDRGTIEIGKRADLVLLEGDPRIDIGNTRKISGIVVAGRWIEKVKLDAMLDELAQRYASGRGS